jgi:UDP-N-acetylmuramoylalanine--D-glutamate ligase
VAILLNITPDHLNRYGGDMEAYAAAKFRIAEQQSEEQTLVFNLDDERILSFARSGKVRSQALGISIQSDATDAAARLRGDGIVVCTNDHEEVLMQAEDLALRGKHNLYNSLAAAVAARVMEVRSDLVRESLATFEGVPHRLELVRELEGVRYINDSKATNVNAVWYALESMREPVILIAGGRDKGNDYAPLAPLVKERVRVLIALGESAAKVENDLGPSAEQCYRARSMDDAVDIAKVAAREGDVVLLSPACASFDQFKNFEARGDAFRRLVANL